MTIKDVAQLTGLSHQAIYKRIKARGLKLEELKDKATGQLSPEGEKAIKELFSIDETARATNVDELTTEIEKLRNQVAAMGKQIQALTEERDFLRVTVERSQQLQAVTLSKLPTPPPALPDSSKRGLRDWLNKLRGKDEHHAE